MTDTEIKRRKAICEAAGVKEIDDVSDGFHTFRQLYYQRMMLFAVIVKQNKDKAWKSLRHEDGELCFDGRWFIVGIDTPEGSYTYHYETNYYNLFDCEELERGKHWDRHTEKDVTRLLSLSFAYSEPCKNDAISRKEVLDFIKKVCFSRKQEWVDFRVSLGSNGQRDLIIKFIESLSSISENPNNWIPVSKRLPETNGRYLVTRGLNACGSMWNRVYIINYSDLMGIKSENGGTVMLVNQILSGLTM